MTRSPDRRWRGELEVCRASPRRLNDDLLRRQARRLRDRAVTRSEAQAGWECRSRVSCDAVAGGFRYTVRLVLTRTTRRLIDESACQAHLARVRDRVLRAGRRWG